MSISACLCVLPNWAPSEALLSESVDHVGMWALMGQILHKHFSCKHIAETENEA